MVKSHQLPRRWPSGGRRDDGECDSPTHHHRAIARRRPRRWSL